MYGPAIVMVCVVCPSIKTSIVRLWDVTIAGLPWCPVWCRLYGTVYWRKQPGNTQNGGTLLLIANLMADSE